MITRPDVNSNGRTDACWWKRMCLTCRMSGAVIFKTSGFPTSSWVKKKMFANHYLKLSLLWECFLKSSLSRWGKYIDLCERSPGTPDFFVAARISLLRGSTLLQVLLLFFGMNQLLCLHQNEAIDNRNFEMQEKTRFCHHFIDLHENAWLAKQ